MVSKIFFRSKVWLHNSEFLVRSWSRSSLIWVLTVLNSMLVILLDVRVQYFFCMFAIHQFFYFLFLLHYKNCDIIELWSDRALVALACRRGVHFDHLVGIYHFIGFRQHLQKLGFFVAHVVRVLGALVLDLVELLQGDTACLAEPVTVLHDQEHHDWHQHCQHGQTRPKHVRGHV